MTLSLSSVRGLNPILITTDNQDILNAGEIVFLKEELIYCLSDTK